MDAHQSINQSNRELAYAGGLSVALLWIAQPPAMMWPFSLVALVPWLIIITRPQPISKRGYLVLWSVSTLFWLLSLQGLRHAHPAMCIPWIALGAYLAVYHVVFVVVARRMLARRIPLIAAIPIAWVAQECARNYLLTGISAAMLGHSMADVPVMIQIADLLGSYGVGLVLAVVNVAAYLMLRIARRHATFKEAWISLAVAAVVIAATIGYGSFRLREPEGDALATFALIQRHEVVEYGHSAGREEEMFRNYATQSIDSIRASGRTVDAVVWPESMFSAAAPWMIAEPNAKPPGDRQIPLEDFQFGVNQYQTALLERAGHVQNLIALASKSATPPHLLVGCGVYHYKDTLHVHSGVLSINPNGQVDDWYGKTHLVMFGEYVPIAPYIPGLRSLIPPGLGLKPGPGAKQFMVGETMVSPNICIETAVERVTVNQLASSTAGAAIPDVVVTVTNDGWFDDSSVIDHHLRCAQMVAVGCRRPILSAANNGPTAWIDSRGIIVDRLPTGVNGALIATPLQDHRTSLYLLIGDWPARLCVLACLTLLIVDHSRKRQPSR